MNAMAIARIVIVRQNHGRVKVRIWAVNVQSLTLIVADMIAR